MRYLFRGTRDLLFRGTRVPHAHMHTCTHAHMHTCTHAHMHTCTCTHTPTHIHTHTHTHAHTQRGGGGDDIRHISGSLRRVTYLFIYLFIYLSIYLSILTYAQRGGGGDDIRHISGSLRRDAAPCLLSWCFWSPRWYSYYCDCFNICYWCIICCIICHCYSTLRLIVIEILKYWNSCVIMPPFLMFLRSALDAIVIGIVSYIICHCCSKLLCLLSWCFWGPRWMLSLFVCVCVCV